MTAALAEAGAAPASSRLERWTIATLAACGALLVVLFAVATMRIPLERHFPGEQGITLDFVKMLGPDVAAVTRQYIALFATTFAAYAVAVVVVARALGLRPGWMPPLWLLFGVPVLCALVLLPMYPPQAVDMFHYHASSRTLWIHGANPLTTAPGEFPFPIGYSWSQQPSPYGPLWSLMGGIITLPAQDHFMAALYGFKLMAAASYLGCAYLTWRIVGRRWPDQRALAVVVFAWNPFVLMRVVGNGHNDLVMMAFVLLALLLVERRGWRWAFLALAASALVKYITLLLAPLFLIYYWQHHPGATRDRVAAMVEACAIIAFAAVVAFAPFWEGLATFDTVRGEAEKMVTSTAQAIGAVITGYPEDLDVNGRVLRSLRFAFLAAAVPVWWQSRRDLPRLIVASFTLLMLYLLLAAGWFRPWYLLWPLVFAALRPRSWLTPLLIVTSFAGSFPDIVEQYRVHWSLTQGWTRQVLAPVIVAFVPVVMVWVVAVWRTGSWTLHATDERGADGADGLRGDAAQRAGTPAAG